MSKFTKRAMRSTTRAPPPPATVRQAPVSSAVVGIGASAGGLEALEQFLSHVSVPSGMAFVIVQHLDPTQQGMLVELLQRVSPLPVLQVTDGTVVEAENVYVIPPNRDMSISGGVLHLAVPKAPRGLRLPIDFFFRSMALETHMRVVAVVLSGMGSDGALGLRAVRDNGGGVFVQSPLSAKFDGMPRSAIDAGLADVIAPPAELPSKIEEYLRRAPRSKKRACARPDTMAETGLQEIVGLLRNATGHDFSPYKTSTIYRRIERRMALHQIDSTAHYARYLHENAVEAQLLFGELLIGVTSFFRDAAAWEALAARMPAILAAGGKDATIRAWVPACSTGEEAYSLAIALKEEILRSDPARNVSLQVFATDLDGGAVQTARRGLYPENIAADVSEDRLSRFFAREGESFRVRKEIRDLVVFATQDILQDPPFTKLDLLCCRNLLIYLTTAAQRSLIPLFHYSLKPWGTLFLGSAETVGTFSELFAAIDGKARLYTRLGAATGQPLFIDFGSPSAALPVAAALLPVVARSEEAAPPNLQLLVERLLLSRFAPAAVLATNKGEVLFVSGRTGRYLELPPGKANWNVHAMAREGLRHALGGAFTKAVLTNSPVVLSRVCVGEGESSLTAAVTVEPILDPAALRGTVMVVFADAAVQQTPSPRRETGRGARRAARGSEALKQARDDLRNAADVAQATEQELKSTNEELQSTNEELQSTNEELTTSKEEMQSMNEELQTLNSELSAKMADLSRTSNDMKNLLDSTEIAVLFLDEAMKVRRYTPQAALLVRLIPGDVGRPLADLASDVVYPDLFEDARDVLRTLVFSEKVVGSVSGGRFRVRIMPYRTGDNRIDGLVITFTRVPPDDARPSHAREGAP